MNPPDFYLLLNYLNPDREIAGMEYQRNRERLVKFFECNKCYHAEECADKTFDRIIKIIKKRTKDKKSDSQKLSILGVAHNILKEYWRNPIKKNISLENLSPTNEPAESSNYFDLEESELFFKEQRHNCMRKCFNELSPDVKKLLVRYHKGEKRTRINNRKKLAKQLGNSIGKLRTKVCRIKALLHNCLNSCLEPILSTQ